MTFLTTLINCASAIFLFILLGAALLIFNSPSKAPLQREETSRPRVHTVPGSHATSARLVRVPNPTFRLQKPTTLVVSDDDGLSACFDKLSVKESAPEIVAVKSCPELECSADLSTKESAPEMIASTKPLPELECLVNLTIKELSPRIARSIRPIVACQKAIPSSESSIDPVAASFDKLSVEGPSAPRRRKSNAPPRRLLKQTCADIDMMDFEMSPYPENLATDSFVSTTDALVEPALPVLRSCFKSSNASSTTKKSVHFNTLVCAPAVVRSEVRFFEPTPQKGKEFRNLSDEERAGVYLSSSNYPHEFGRTAIVVEGDKYFLLKEIGTFHTPEKVGTFVPKEPRRRHEGDFT